MKTPICIKKFLRVFILCGFLFFSFFSKAQTTNISGIINDYVRVSAFDTTGCKAKLEVTSASAFSVGDSVLLIQMKGANFDSSNTSAFGNIVNLNGAGNYEIGAISSITSNTIMLNGKLLKTYLKRGYLQLVRIPVYTNATITASLTCQPWNGQTGGVLIFSVQNNLQFNADIDVSGRGFRGGTVSLNPDGFCGIGSPDFYYPVNPGGTSWPSGGAQKGEGIGSVSQNKEAGKGRLVNGGGGGNKHNAGGGGGSNYTSGGRGGFEYASCISTHNGLGGLALDNSYTNTVIFAGGGGGCGDFNNAAGSAGENGGGIIIITTASVTGNNFIVNASGFSVTTVAGNIGDGAGGGGGGGAIFLNAGTILSPASLIANGGTGGDQGGAACVGPGGGGGTGVIFTSLPSLAGMTYSLLPGPAGAFINGACSSINYGAMAGSTNTVGPLTSKSLPYTPPAITYTASTATVSVCSGLPLSFSATVVGDNYSWNGPSFTSSVANPTITPSAVINTGEYTLTVSSLNGCTSIITTSANVNPTPTVSVPNFSVCAGLTINIVPSVTAVSTYSWSGPSGFSSTAPTVSLTNASPSMAGNYNLTVTSVEGCTSSSTGSIGVAVVNGITVSVNSPVCAGGTLTLNSGGGSGGLAFLWSGPSSYNSSTQNSTITPVTLANAGDYTLTASVNGCSATPITASVVVEAPPVISVANASVCTGHSVTIGASSPTGSGYQWNGPGNFVFPGPTFSFSNASATLAGQYNVTVTSVLGCTNTASAFLSVIITPSITLSSDQPVCVGATLNFTTSGGTSYHLAGPGGFSSNAVNPVITNAQLSANGIYTLTGAALSCSATATSSVVIKPNPVPTVNMLAPVCAPRNFQLIAGGGVTYTWSGPGSFTSSVHNPTIGPTSLASAGVYTVTIEGFNGCRSSTTTAVSVITTPTVAASGATVCFGQPAILTATGAVTYTWTGPSNYLNNSANAFIPVANNSAIGDYTLFVTTINTCTVSTVVNLGLNILPVPVISAPTRACINGTVLLQGLGGVSYLWRGPVSYTSAAQNPTLVPPNASYAGIYSLTVLSAEGCSAVATTTLSLDPLPTGKLTGDLDRCVPFCSDFKYKPLGLSSIVSTTWITTTQYTTGSNFYYCVKNPGDYLISAIFTDSLGCKNSNSFVVHGRPKPTADFQYLPLQPIESTDMVVFTSTSSGDNIDARNWYFENNYGYKTSGSEATYFFERAGEYPVVLTVKNVYGCWDTIVKAIEVLSDLNMYVPDAFTPNGDGKNEIFQPKGTNVTTYELKIYDRWGQKIFETKNFEDGWDGTFKGSPCKTDVYVWEIKTIKANGKQRYLTGKVLLCR
ncbi:MAG: gliding motility-associated C-terminal domain-containing protein [Bacteroidota bacterium]